MTDPTRSSNAQPAGPTRLARALIFIAAGLVLAATLYPTEMVSGGPPIGCLICGDRGLADALLNIILFMPLGAAAALTGRSTRTALVIGALLSGAVEFAQMSLIPGRDASTGDLLFNTLGAAAGVTVLKTSPFWLGYDSRLAGRLSLAASFLALVTIAITGVLLVPQTPDGTYFVMWSPALTHLDPYNAPVTSVTIGGQPFAPSRIEDPSRIRELLEAGARIRIDAIAAPGTSRQSALFAIYDDQKREVVLIGPDREDLVFRLRLRATSALMDHPDFRIPGGWRSVVPGSPVTVTAYRSGNHYCLGFGLEPSCGGFFAAMGWALFLYVEHWPALFKSTLNLLWLGVLALPTGFWARRRWESVLAGALWGVAVLVVPRLVGLLPTPPHHLLAVFVGLAVGAVLARLVVPNR